MITYTYLATKTISETEKLFHQNVEIPNIQKKSGPPRCTAGLHQWILLLYFTGDHDRLGSWYSILVSVIWFTVQKQLQEPCTFLGWVCFSTFMPTWTQKKSNKEFHFQSFSRIYYRERENYSSVENFMDRITGQKNAPVSQKSKKKINTNFK